MGNFHSRRDFFRFIENISMSTFDLDKCHSGDVVWLSHVGLFWIWKDEADLILQYIRKKTKHSVDIHEKSVVDMLDCVKLYRHERGKPHMTEDEEKRYIIFSKFRKTRGSPMYPVDSERNFVTGHIMEYIPHRSMMFEI